MSAITSTSVQGRVAPNGAVRVAVQAGGQWANGSGHLSMTRGGGVWRGQGSAGYCKAHGWRSAPAMVPKPKQRCREGRFTTMRPAIMRPGTMCPAATMRPATISRRRLLANTEVTFSGGLLGRPFPGAPQREVLRCSATKVPAAAVAAAMRD